LGAARRGGLRPYPFSGRWGVKSGMALSLRSYERTTLLRCIDWTSRASRRNFLFETILRYFLTIPSAIASWRRGNHIAGFILSKRIRLAHIITLDVAAAERRRGWVRPLLQKLSQPRGARGAFDFAGDRNGQ